ncbi:unnamed protein product, partial [Prorocentrum cordatum]
MAGGWRRGPPGSARPAAWRRRTSGRAMAWRGWAWQASCATPAARSAVVGRPRPRAGAGAAVPWRPCLRLSPPPASREKPGPQSEALAAVPLRRHGAPRRAPRGLRGLARGAGRCAQGGAPAAARAPGGGAERRRGGAGRGGLGARAPGPGVLGAGAGGRARGRAGK